VKPEKCRIGISSWQGNLAEESASVPASKCLSGHPANKPRFPTREVWHCGFRDSWNSSELNTSTPSAKYPFVGIAFAATRLYPDGENERNTHMEGSMRLNRYGIGLILSLVLMALPGCHPRIDLLAKAEKGFIKMIDKTGQKLDLDTDQKAQLEKLKSDIRRNFEEGRIKRSEALASIKEESLKENPDIRKMTSLLQVELRDGTERINGAFDLMLDFQKNLNEGQKRKLNGMISQWVRKWHSA
jgi:hypothetical protein